MSKLNWIEILGWGSETIDDLRTVGYTYIKQGSYGVALTFFEAIAVLAPPTVYDMQTLGALYLQTGNGLKALDFLDRAMKLDPSHLQSQLNRAKSLFLLGYKRQGLMQAHALEKCEDPVISSQASALVLCYER